LLDGYFCFSFIAGKATYISYHFCATINGICISDIWFGRNPNFCEQLGCPLVEGKQYVMTIKKNIPFYTPVSFLPFSSFFFLVTYLKTNVKDAVSSLFQS